MSPEERKTFPASVFSLKTKALLSRWPAEYRHLSAGSQTILQPERSASPLVTAWFRNLPNHRGRWALPHSCLQTLDRAAHELGSHFGSWLRVSRTGTASVPSMEEAGEGGSGSKFSSPGFLNPGKGSAKPDRPTGSPPFA